MIAQSNDFFPAELFRQHSAGGGDFFFNQQTPFAYIARDAASMIDKSKIK
jgi:hypothetical protein